MDVLVLRRHSIRAQCIPARRAAEKRLILGEVAVRQMKTQIEAFLRAWR